MKVLKYMDNKCGRGWVITDGKSNIINDNNGIYYHSDSYDNGVYTSTKTAKDSQAYKDGGKLMGMMDGMSANKWCPKNIFYDGWLIQELNEKALKNMTKPEKLEAITKRLKEINVDIDINMISCLVISKYFSDFQKKDLIDGELVMSESGLRVVAIAEDFHWLPTNKEIKDYVNELVSSENNNQLIEMLIDYRDNPVEFMEKIDSSE